MITAEPISSSSRRPRFEQTMLTIHDRRFPVDDRSEAGHWEDDLIIVKNHSTAIGTLVERQTRMVRLRTGTRTPED